MPEDSNSRRSETVPFSVSATPECVATLRRWAHLLRELRAKITEAHQTVDVSVHELTQQAWFDEHDLEVATALEALAESLDRRQRHDSSLHPIRCYQEFCS